MASERISAWGGGKRARIKLKWDGQLTDKLCDSYFLAKRALRLWEILPRGVLFANHKCLYR
jgi:hypothetical protein